MDSDIDTSSSWATVMCRATRFHITVSLKDIRKSRFETEYSEMVSKVLDDDEEEDYDTLCEWIVDPCVPFFRESTLNVPTYIAFRDFYFPQTHHLKLLVSESSLYPKETRNRGTINPFHFMIPSADLPTFPEVPRSKCRIFESFRRHNGMITCQRYLRRPLSATVLLSSSSPRIRSSNSYEKLTCIYASAMPDYRTKSKSPTSTVS